MPELQPAKFHGHLRRGDVFIHETAGAGGWGDPLERDPARVLRDVRNGFVSAARRGGARYGVVLAAGTATRWTRPRPSGMRARLRAGRGWRETPFALRDDPAPGAVGRGAMSGAPAAVRVGVDIGGTFTDIVIMDGGRRHRHPQGLVHRADNYARAISDGPGRRLRRARHRRPPHVKLRCCTAPPWPPTPSWS